MGLLSLRTQRQTLGGGGVIRDDKGNWVVGYAGNIAITNPFDDQLVPKFEVLALLHGLQLALKYNLRPLEINLDATQVIDNLKTITTTY